MKSSSLVRPFFFVALPLAALLVLLIFGGLEVYGYLTGSRKFVVESVEVLTDGPANKADLIALAAVRTRSNIFMVSLEEIKKRVETHPWVYSAMVTRALPSKIQIQYIAQEPVAILNAGENLYYVNQEGKPFHRLEKEDSLQYPFIHLENVSKLEVLPPDRLMAAMEIVEWTKKSTLLKSKDLGDISVHGSVYSEQAPLLVTVAYPPNSIQLKQRAKRSFFTLSFAETEIPQQTKRAEAVIAHLVQQGKNPRLIRLELGKKVVVKMDQKL